jgi:hypothetical protein
MRSEAFTGVVLNGIDPPFGKNAIRLMEAAQNEQG